MVPRTLRLTTIPSTSGPPIGDLEILINDQRRRREKVPIKFWAWGVSSDAQFIPNYVLFDRPILLQVYCAFH